MENFKMRKGVNLQDWLNSVGEDAWEDGYFYQDFRMLRKGYGHSEYPEALPDLIRRTIKLIMEIQEYVDHTGLSWEELEGAREDIKSLIDKYDPKTYSS